MRADTAAQPPSPAPARPDPLPPAAEERLRTAAITEEDVLLYVRTDIDRLGNYHPAWMVVTAEQLLVVAATGEIDLELPLGEIAEIRTEAVVGAGILQVRVDELVVDVLRYSNRDAYRFEHIARRLQRFLEGQPLEIHEDDLRDPGRCEECGLALDPGEPCARCVSRGAVLTRMLRLMRPYRAATAAMMGLLLFGVALDLVSPQLTRYLVDEVLPTAGGQAQQVSAAAHARLLELLLIVVLILAGVQIARMIVNIINGRLASRIGTAITFDMRSRLVDHLEKLSISFYDRQQMGGIIGRVAYDTEAVHGLIWQATSGFLLQILMVVGVWLMMLTLDLRLALLALVPAPLVMGATVFFWRKIYPRYYRTWDASSKQSSALSGMLTGIRAVKAFGQEQRELGRFQEASGRLRGARHRVDASIATFNGVVGIVFQLGGWFVWYFGGQAVLGNEMSLGELMAFFGYLWMFYGPLAALPQLTSWLTQFVTQANRIFEVLDTPVTVPEPARPVPVAPVQGRIRFEDVSFAYESHSPALRQVSFEIKPGELVGIVGPSGSGKTTLINLLSRFYDVDEGRVLLDDVDVRDIEKRELRTSIGVVLQEPTLFPGSISDNIAYGRPEAELAEVLLSARAANCHEFILRHPHGYDTWLGERGAGLSGGERQRLGIARALLVDPRVLILDEATSNVDAESEAAIQEALAELIRGRTTIAIAHRLSTLRSADRIVVMERGRVTEEGSHEHLVRNLEGTYRRLLQMQGLLDEAGYEPSSTPTAVGRGARRGGPRHDFRPRWLEPGRVGLEAGPHGTVQLTIGPVCHRSVTALRCFPVQAPEALISLRMQTRDGYATELGMIRDLAEWPRDDRRVLEELLRRRYFVHTIEQLRSMELVANHLNVVADTDLGPVEFTMRWQPESAQDYGERGKMLFDVDDNHYLVPDVEALPKRERKLYDKFIYW